MRLSERVQHFLQGKPVGLLVDNDVVNAKSITATRQYDAYGYFDIRRLFGDLGEGSLLFLQDSDIYPPYIDADFCVSDGEWAVIRPLFELYVEKENALLLEASRGLGVDAYGRSVAEIEADITQKELELPSLAFDQPIETV